jgi:hypothetical protein
MSIIRTGLFMEKSMVSPVSAVFLSRIKIGIRGRVVVVFLSQGRLDRGSAFA